MSKRFRFHDRNPDKHILRDKLTTVTQRNLKNMEALLGVRFNKRAQVWKIAQATWGGRKREKFALDILVRGRWNHEPVEFWRHETRNVGAGQTLFYWRGNKFIFHKFMSALEKAPELMDQKHWKLLLAHDDDMVRFIAQAQLNTPKKGR